MGVTLSNSQINIKMEIGMSSLTAVHVFFYKKNFYKKMSLKRPKNIKKMLRKSPASTAWAGIFKNAALELELFKSYKIE